MPANLTPEYLDAKEKYQNASTPEEELDCLQDMLRLLPKHKGTDKIQADLRQKISDVKEKIERQKKQQKSTKKDFFYVERQGAAQILLVGYPSVGKSSLIRSLTNAEPEVGNYPYTTTKPMPGMMEHRKIQVQLVDTPPVSEDVMKYWIPNIVRIADAVLLVVDLDAHNILDQIDVVKERLREGKVKLTGEKVESDGSDRIAKISTIVVGNKLDCPEAQNNLEALRELYGEEFPIIGVSSQNGDNLEDLKTDIYDMLGIIRVFTKSPGKDADMEKPYVLKKGSTVEDLAEEVHRELAQSFQAAKVWGSGKFDGQKVKQDHVLEDGDIVEIKL